MVDRPGAGVLAEALAGEEDARVGRRAHATDRVEQMAEIVVVLALAVEVVAMFGNVIFRSLLDSSLLWSLEVGELALVVMTFVGGAIAYPRNEHMALHAVVRRLPRSWQARIEAFCHWQVFAMALFGGVARLADDAVALGRAHAVPRPVARSGSPFR